MLPEVLGRVNRELEVLRNPNKDFPISSKLARPRASNVKTEGRGEVAEFYRKAGHSSPGLA